MFEIDIKEKSREGVTLHKQDGTTSWKLMLTCTREGCDNEVDMGECLCFDEEKEMARCRDEHGMHCTTKCWHEDAPRERIEKVLKDIERHNKIWGGDHEDDPTITGDTELELLEAYFEMVADEWDGESFYEMYDIEECPI